MEGISKVRKKYCTARAVHGVSRPNTITVQTAL